MLEDIDDAHIIKLIDWLMTGVRALLTLHAIKKDQQKRKKRADETDDDRT